MTQEVKVSIHHPSGEGGRIKKDVIHAETPVHIFVEEVVTGVDKHPKIPMKVKPVPDLLLNTLASRVLANLDTKFENKVGMPDIEYAETGEDVAFDVLEPGLWDKDLDPEHVIEVIMNTEMLTDLKGDKRMFAQYEHEVRSVVDSSYREARDFDDIS